MGIIGYLVGGACLLWLIIKLNKREDGHEDQKIKYLDEIDQLNEKLDNQNKIIRNLRENILKERGFTGEKLKKAMDEYKQHDYF